MKKYLYPFMMALMVILSFAFVSCSSDDDGDGAMSASIVGTWKNNTFYGSGELEDFYGEQYVQFRADGRYIEVEVGGYGSEGKVNISEGRWQQSGNTIVLSETDEITATVVISKLTDTDFILYWGGLSMSYKRVADSEIEKYLN